MTQQTGYSEDPYSRPSPRLPLHHFSQRRMLASLLRREARRSQGDLEALARGQRFFYLHRFTLCCCMLFTTLRCQPPPHSHLERPIINPIFLEYNMLVPERHGRRPSPWAAKKKGEKDFFKYLSQKILSSCGTESSRKGAVAALKSSRKGCC